MGIITLVLLVIVAGVYSIEYHTKFDIMAIHYHSKINKYVVLEGYKIQKIVSNEPQKWASIGYPTIHIGDSGRPLFVPTVQALIVHVITLDDSQKESLLQAVKQKYPSEKDLNKTRNIMLMPLEHFSCSASLAVNGTNKVVNGSVWDFHSLPYALKFPYPMGSPERAALDKYTRDQGMIFECLVTGVLNTTFSATYDLRVA